MDLDTILEDTPEGRESDIGSNTMDILISLKNGLDMVLMKVAVAEIGREKAEYVGG